MDVHAPLEPIHSWRDIAIHLAIVTVGLFIALMLEAGVEYWHHRHIVAEARANIRTELERDHQEAQKDLAYLDKNIATIQGNVKEIHELSKRPKNYKGSITNGMNFASLNEAAWRTARDMGALSYMPYDEVQRYSDVYMLAELVNQKAVSAGEQNFRAAAPFYMGYDIDKLPDEEYAQMLRDNAATQINLVTLKQFVQQFDQAAEAELKR